MDLNNLKIPLSFKILAILINILLLIFLIIILNFELNIFFIGTLISFLLFNFLFYKSFKLNKIAINFLLIIFILIIPISFYILIIHKDIITGWILLIILLWINLIGIFFILLSLFWIIATILLKRKLKKINLENKYFTNKNQYKTFIIISTTLSILLIIFRLWYYNSPYKQFDIKNDDWNDFFTTKYENLEIKNDDNLYFDLKSFWKKYDFSEYARGLKINIKDCLYFNKCYDYELYKDIFKKDKKQKNIWINWFKNEILKDSIEIENVKVLLKKQVEIFNTFDNKIIINQIIIDFNNNYSNKKYYKWNINETVYFTSLIQFYREANNKIIYLFETGQQDEATKLLKSLLKVSLTMVNWDNNIIDTLIWQTTLKITLGNLNLIIDNFQISENNKNILLTTLENNKVDENIMSNSIKNYYNSIISYELDLINKINPELPGKYIYYTLWKTTFLNYEETINSQKYFTYELINNEKHCLSDKEIIKYLNINLLKENQMWNELILNSYNCYENQYKKIDDLIKLKVETLKNLKANSKLKIDKKTEIIENNTEEKILEKENFKDFWNWFTLEQSEKHSTLKYNWEIIKLLFHNSKTIPFIWDEWCNELSNLLIESIDKSEWWKQKIWENLWEQWQKNCMKENFYKTLIVKKTDNSDFFLIIKQNYETRQTLLYNIKTKKLLNLSWIDNIKKIESWKNWIYFIYESFRWCSWGLKAIINNKKIDLFKNNCDVDLNNIPKDYQKIINYELLINKEIKVIFEWSNFNENEKTLNLDDFLN